MVQLFCRELNVTRVNSRAELIGLWKHACRSMHLHRQEHTKLVGGYLRTLLDTRYGLLVTTTRYDDSLQPSRLRSCVGGCGPSSSPEVAGPHSLRPLVDLGLAARCV